MKDLGCGVDALLRSPYLCSGIATPSVSIFRPVTAGLGFLQSRDPHVHFGSGPENKVASIAIRWPGEIVQTDTVAAPYQVRKIEGPEK